MFLLRSDLAAAVLMIPAYYMQTLATEHSVKQPVFSLPFTAYSRL